MLMGRAVPLVPKHFFLHTSKCLVLGREAMLLGFWHKVLCKGSLN